MHNPKALHQCPVPHRLEPDHLTFEGRRGKAISDVNKQTPNENKILTYSGIRQYPWS